ncbi:ORF6N domain-containing protein, partial [Escherichia coli]|uniref:ORF6N domain-containing protein n=1 Tax=Escherichia coli TaxID=562 RepID=UPI002263F14D
MKTLPTVNTLQPILHNQIPVITSELLAQLYGTKIKNISDNFLNNTTRFVAGKHYFKIEKNELREFKNRPETIGLVGKNARSLILWTERGAARHAKMLETDQAWDVFERMEDCYFNQNAQTAATVTVSPNNAREVVDTLNAKPMFYIKVCNNEPLTTSADVAQAFSTTNNSIVMAIDALRIP